MKFVSSTAVAVLLAAGAFGQDAVTEDNISLTLKYPFVEIGEGVTFTIRNDSGATIYPDTQPVYTIYKGSKVVRKQVIRPRIFLIIPNGGERTMTWDQKDDSGKPVTTGTYTVVVTGARADGSAYTLKTDFEILSKSANGSITWRTPRFFYTAGQQVKLCLLNKSSKTVLLSDSAPWSIYRRVFSWNGYGEKLVYSPVAVMVTTPVPGGGGRKMWIWDQTDNNGQQVSSGLYNARIKGYLPGYGSFVLKRWFQIIN